MNHQGHDTRDNSPHLDIGSVIQDDSNTLRIELFQNGRFELWRCRGGVAIKELSLS